MDRISSNTNLFVMQTRRGCLQETMGCEAKTEFNISTNQDKNTHILYALEESGCCIRTFCPNIRNWKMDVAVDKNSPAFLEIERPMRCGPVPLKCCCYQEVIAREKGGKELGSIREEMFFCVPQFSILSANGTKTGVIHQPTCVGGACVDCFAEGCYNCRIPFYIYNNEADEVHDGKIVKVWTGLTSELFTDADNFELDFPAKADAATKATLLGAVFLLNQLFFEGTNDSGLLRNTTH